MVKGCLSLISFLCPICKTVISFHSSLLIAFINEVDKNISRDVYRRGQVNLCTCLEFPLVIPQTMYNLFHSFSEFT